MNEPIKGCSYNRIPFSLWASRDLIRQLATKWLKSVDFRLSSGFRIRFSGSKFLPVKTPPAELSAFHEAIS